MKNVTSAVHSFLMTKLPAPSASDWIVQLMMFSRRFFASSSLRPVLSRSQFDVFPSLLVLSAPLGHGCIPIPVELDDECKGGIEPDIVLAMRDQGLGELPALRRPLQTMKNILNFGDGLGRVWLVECSD